MDQVICKTGIIIGSRIIPKGTVLSIPGDISVEDAERLLVSGEELETYDNITKITPDNDQSETDENDRPLSMKEITTKLKELGVAVPFGANKEKLSKLLDDTLGKGA